MRLPANKLSVLAEASEAVDVFHQVGGGGNAFGGSGHLGGRLTGTNDAVWSQDGTPDIGPPDFETS